MSAKHGIGIRGVERGWLPRWIALVQGSPRRTLAIAVLLAFFSLVYASCRLQFRTQRTDLLDADHPIVQDYERFRTEFDHESDMLVVVEGDRKERLIAVIESIAAELRRKPQYFTKLLYRLQIDRIRAKGLYQLSLPVLAAVENRLEPLRPLLTGGPGGLLGDATWSVLSLEMALVDLQTHLFSLKPGETPDPIGRQTLSGTITLLRSLADFLASSGECNYRSPWGSPNDAGDLALPTDLGEIPEYLFSPNGRLAVLRVLPVRDTSTFVGVGGPVAELRDVVARLGKAAPDVRIGLTGLPILEDDEMQTAMSSSGWASLFELVGVMLVFVVGFRALRHPLFVLAALATAACWTLGFVALTIGHLNILSMTFIVTLIGMGVDFGVVWLARYECSRSRGDGPAAANLDAANSIGPGIVSGAMTTIVAFYATIATHFLGLREMGWIAGTGVLFCLVATLTVLPALLVLCGGAAFPEKRGRRDLLPAFPIVQKRPRLVIACTLVVVGGLGSQLPRLSGDFNLLHLQAPGLDSVQWEGRLLTEMGTSGWYALSQAASPEAARRLKSRFEALPEVGRVVEIASLMPERPEAKQPVIQRIHDLLHRLPAVLPATAAAHADSFARALTNLSKASPRGESSSGGRLRAVALQVGAALQALPANLRDARLTEFQNAWRTDLFRQLQSLQSASDPEQVAVADLPASLVERMRGHTGAWQLQIFPKTEAWDLDPLCQFVQALRSVDPHVTGEPVTALHGVVEMIDSYRTSAYLSALVVFLACWIDLKRLSITLLAMIPLTMGCVATFGLMAIFNIAFNPANLIALPLILGIGVDFGVHVLHDYQHSNGRYVLNWQFARALLLTTTTTLIGFASLLISGHWGMVSIGIVLSLGVATCSLLALLFLPAMLELISTRRECAVVERPHILSFPARRLIPFRRAA